MVESKIIRSEKSITLQFDERVTCIYLTFISNKRVYEK
jgi:hypothetical protein